MFIRKGTKTVLVLLLVPILTKLRLILLHAVTRTGANGLEMLDLQEEQEEQVEQVEQEGKEKAEEKPSG